MDQHRLINIKEIKKNNSVHTRLYFHVYCLVNLSLSPSAWPGNAGCSPNFVCPERAIAGISGKNCRDLVFDKDRSLGDLAKSEVAREHPAECRCLSASRPDDAGQVLAGKSPGQTPHGGDQHDTTTTTTTKPPAPVGNDEHCYNIKVGYRKHTCLERFDYDFDHSHKGTECEKATEALQNTYPKHNECQCLETKKDEKCPNGPNNDDILPDDVNPDDNDDNNDDCYNIAVGRAGYTCLDRFNHHMGKSQKGNLCEKAAEAFQHVAGRHKQCQCLQKKSDEICEHEDDDDEDDDKPKPHGTAIFFSALLFPTSIFNFWSRLFLFSIYRIPVASLSLSLYRYRWETTVTKPIVGIRVQVIIRLDPGDRPSGPWGY